MIDLDFYDNEVNGGADSELFEAQENHMAIVLECVLHTNEGKRLTRKHPKDPRQIWRLHKKHKNSSFTSANICTGLSQELANRKVADFPHPTKCLDMFDSHLEKFNKMSKENMPESMAIMYLKSATHGNKELLSAWASCETVTQNMYTNTTPT